jgi:hypothetical protein
LYRYFSSSSILLSYYYEYSYFCFYFFKVFTSLWSFFPLGIDYITAYSSKYFYISSSKLSFWGDFDCFSLCGDFYLIGFVFSIDDAFVSIFYFDIFSVSICVSGLSVWFVSILIDSLCYSTILISIKIILTIWYSIKLLLR